MRPLADHRRAMRDSLSDIDRLTRPYSTILCDIWGVIHDGAHLLPGADHRLQAFKRAGKKVILITNAPRPASRIQAGLDRIGLPRTDYDAITSSGAAGIAALRALGRPVGFIGTAEDRADLVANGVEVVDGGFDDVAVTGLDEVRGQAAQYRDQLALLARRDVLLHCLNPDRVVIHRGQRIACAGALADMYEALGGRTCWYGKPHRPIYEHALQLAGNPDLADVLAIGDGPVTDMLGAARLGIDALFVSGGIHAGEPFPEDFGDRHGVPGWRPIATVTDLG